MPDLQDGESVEVKGSAAKPYLLRNIGGVYSCSCPAWRNQSAAIESRMCKHLRKLRGDAAETERIGSELPAKSAKSSASKDAPPLLLAQSWDNAIDLTDWWMSEKLDGVRLLGRPAIPVAGSSNKFWQVSVDANEVTVCYGRIGSHGTTKVHTCGDSDTAAARREKLVAEKMSKGYVEKNAT